MRAAAASFICGRRRCEGWRWRCLVADPADRLPVAAERRVPRDAFILANRNFTMPVTGIRSRSISMKFAASSR